MGTGLGYFIGGIWMLALGAVFVLSEGVSDPTAVPAAVAATGAASALALLAVTIDEADEAFANVYSTAVSIQNVAAKVSQRALVVGVAALATFGALVLEIASYESFLLLLGSFFVPLFGVLLADWLLSGASYAKHDFFAGPRLRIGPTRRLARRVRALPVAPPARPGVVGRARRADESARDPDRLVASELRARLRAGARPRATVPAMIAVAECANGLYLIEVGADADEDEVAGHEPGGSVERPRPVELAPDWVSALLVDVDANGSAVVVLVDRKPPLLVSHDAGSTWQELGGGLPSGKAVAVGDNPDDLLYGARNRLYVSRNGGIFWRALGVELPEVRDVAWG